MTDRPHRLIWSTVFLVVAIAVVFVRVAPFLAPGTLPARGDPSLPFPGSDLTPQFAPFTKIASDVLFKQGKIAFWNPFVLCGAPLFETPQAGVVSLATLLDGPLDYIAAVKISMVIHLVAGMIGVFIFGRRLGVRPLSAATGSLMFGLGGFLLDHFRIGHLNLIYATTIMPWVFLAFSQAQRSARVLSPSALVAGLLIAIQILEGGDTAVFYELFALALAIPVALALREPGIARRSLCIVAVIGAVAFVLSAFQLVPMAAYMRLTGRAGGISLAQALRPFHESQHRLPGVLALGLLGVGIAGSWHRARFIRVNVIWLGAIAVGSIAVAVSPAVFSALWHVVPAFSYQRVPERALVLMAVTGPVLAARGLETVSIFVGRVWKGFTLGSVVGVVVAGVGIEAWLRSAAMPPMASVSRELEANDAMQWVAAHANGARMHVAETSDRNWGTEHDTVPLGIEVIAGYTPSDHHDYLKGELDSPVRRMFLQATYQNPAVLWGMLDVRFLLSTIPRSLPGFRLATVAKPCPVEICQPRKSSGPYIYENMRCLPRAWTVTHAVVFVGSEAEANFQAALDVLVQPWFDPATLVVLQVQPGTPISAADLTFATDSSSPSMVPMWDDGALEKIRSLTTQIKGEVVTANAVVRPNANRIYITDAKPGWLVVSERIGLFPGWGARANGGEVTIERANGVLGAIHLRARSDVDLRYRPRGFCAGLVVLGLGTLLFAGWKIAFSAIGNRKT